METIGDPPGSGVNHVGIIDEGKIMVTYERFTGHVIPHALRMWVYDAEAKRHVETQLIRSPHQFPILQLVVDHEKRKFYTMSCDTVKCWEEVDYDANEMNRVVVASCSKYWTVQSHQVMPSRRMRAMRLSDDGSVLFACDDSVYAFNVWASGTEWHHLAVMTQSETTTPLCDLCLTRGGASVAARSPKSIFIWSVPSGVLTTIFDDGASPTALCHFGDRSMVAAFSDGTLRLLNPAAGPEGAKEVARTAANPRRCNISFMSPMDNERHRVATIDRVRGLQVMDLRFEERKCADVGLENSLLPEPDTPGVASFFRVPRGLLPESVNEEHEYSAAGSQVWLGKALGAAPYLAAPMPSVLSAYLEMSSRHAPLLSVTSKQHSD
jgi:hypothetical protein